MEILYRFLFRIMIVPLLLRLYFKGKRVPQYRQNWQERLGKKLPILPKNKKIIWLHAVSVGEMNAAQAFLELFNQTYSNVHFLITMTTPTGRETAQKLPFENKTLCYLPYDCPEFVARFLKHFSPKVAFFMETEIWVEMLKQLEKQHIPAILLNGRMSAKSARNYARFSKFMRCAFANLNLIFAQSQKDARRFQFLGGKNVHVCGNFKFDLSLDSEKIQQGKMVKKNLKKPFVILAASTRNGEEALILNAFSQSSLKENALLVIVPRHVERSCEIEILAKKRNLNVEKRSNNMPTEYCQVWLGNTMGEMSFYYALSDAVLMGGTFLNTGGQNFIEAAMCDCALILGPSRFNFAFASQKAKEMQAAVFVENADNAFLVLENWAKNPQNLRDFQQKARFFAQNFGGATQKTMDLLKDFLCKYI